MRVLLDENLDRRLARMLGGGIEATTVRAMGWSGRTNGELLETAQREFDAFLTMDRGIPHQQNPRSLDLAVVVLRARSNDIADIAPLVDEIKGALGEARPGEVVEVGGRE